MSSKLVFLILSTLLLAQCSVGRPPQDEVTTAVPDDENPLSNKETQEKLLKVVNLSLGVSASALKNIFEKTIEAIDAKKDKSEALTEKTEQLEDFIEQLDDVLNIENTFVKLGAYDAVESEINRDLIQTDIYKQIAEDPAAKDVLKKIITEPHDNAMQKGCAELEKLLKSLGMHPVQYC